MKKVPTRIVIYPNDVERITGMQERTARKLLQRVRATLNKSSQQFVTVKEFCHYTGLKEEEVNLFLVD